MASSSYLIIDDFQAGQSDRRVLVLDRPYDLAGNTTLHVDGEEYTPALCSIPDWIIIKSRESFTGKTAVFS